MTTTMRTAPPRRVRRHQGTYRRRSWLRAVFDVFLYFLYGAASGAALLAVMYLAATWLGGA